MERLPLELIELVLKWRVQTCYFDKNQILPLRLVCKTFDTVLKPIVCRTVQLELSKFLRNQPTPRVEDLRQVGPLCHAIYLDMMVIRDEEEIQRLSEVFKAIKSRSPEMGTLLNSLRKYCLGEDTFDESDFGRVMGGVLNQTYNLTRLKVNLPFQIVGRESLTATLILAQTLACLAQRDPEAKPLEMLVLDHVADTTVINICNNPIDLQNAVAAFSSLLHLAISVKRQEVREQQQGVFTRNMWYLLRKAVGLVTLCLVGCNVRRGPSRIHRHHVSLQEWRMRSLPYDPIAIPQTSLKCLRSLELKRLDIDPDSFIALIEDNCTSLREIYLIDVYLKINSTAEQENTCLWIGHADTARPAQCCWIADALRCMEGLNLSILRASGLGYDDFHPDTLSPTPKYDLPDPKNLHRPFDQRFVEAVMGNDRNKLEIDATMREPLISTPTNYDAATISDHSLPEIPESNFEEAMENGNGSENATTAPARSRTSQLIAGPATAAPDIVNITEGPIHPVNQGSTLGHCNILEYDAKAYMSKHNPTSYFKQCIDETFHNHNEQALKELQRLITVADRGMDLISAEIERSHAARINTSTGTVGIP